MPNVHWSLRLSCFLYKTSSCNFVLESLWISGTSILKIQYIQINLWDFISMWRYCMYSWNCSMLLSALGCVGPPFCRTIMQTGVFSCHTRWNPVTAQGDAGVRIPVLLCSCMVVLDCRRLVKAWECAKRLPSSPLYVCMYKIVTY